MTRPAGVRCPSTDATLPARTTKKSQSRSPSANRTSPGWVLRRRPCAASAAIWASLSRGYAPWRSGVSGGSSDEGFVDIAPAPVLARLERLDDRVTVREGVGPGMTERRRVAAAHVPAGQAQAQVHPRGPQHEAFLAAARGLRRHRADQAQGGIDWPQ